RPLMKLAEELVAEAQDAAPLRFFFANADEPARYVACHSLTTAQVLARVVRHDPGLRGQPVEALLAALLHDVGMLDVPVDILARSGPLDAAQHRTVAAHTRLGAALAARRFP